MSKYQKIECRGRNGSRKCVVISHFAGKPVRGMAKCNMEKDTYNSEKGFTLATARCDLNVAIAREKRATERLLAARAALEEAQAELNSASAYYADAHDDVSVCEKLLKTIEEDMRY